MGDLHPISSIMETSNRAKAIMAGNFSLEGEDLTEGSQALIRCFNNYWDTNIYSLQTQLRFTSLTFIELTSIRQTNLGLVQHSKSVQRLRR